jgi:hypothetical protein
VLAIVFAAWNTPRIPCHASQFLTLVHRRSSDLTGTSIAEVNWPGSSTTSSPDERSDIREKLTRISLRSCGLRIPQKPKVVPLLAPACLRREIQLTPSLAPRRRFAAYENQVNQVPRALNKSLRVCAQQNGSRDEAAQFRE